MIEQNLISKLLKIIYCYALGTVLIYEIIIIYSSSINLLYFFIPALFVAVFFYIYYINRQKNLSRSPGPLKKKWYSYLPNYFWLVYCYSFLIPLLFVIPFGGIGLIFSAIISTIFFVVILFRKLYLYTIGKDIEKPSKQFEEYKKKEILIKGLIIGFALIPMIILYISFLSIMMAIILLLPGIGYYLYSNRRKIVLRKINEILILIIIIILSITPLIIERTLIRHNYKYNEDYNVDPGVSINIISKSESYNHNQELNWSTILQYEEVVFPNERVLYKNKINDDKNQFFIPYHHSKESFYYNFSAKPITTPLIIDYAKDYGYFKYNLNDIHFNISGTYFDENYFNKYCFCYFYINSSHYNPPNITSDSASISHGFLVIIHMIYDYHFAPIGYLEWDQKHIIILNDDHEILFVLIVSSVVSFIDYTVCGCKSKSGKL